MSAIDEYMALYFATHDPMPPIDQSALHKAAWADLAALRARLERAEKLQREVQKKGFVFMELCTQWLDTVGHKRFPLMTDHEEVMIQEFAAWLNEQYTELAAALREPPVKEE